MSNQATRKSIPFSKPSLGEAEIRAAVSAIERASLVGNGPIGRQVEKELRARCHSRFAFLTPSCTHAIELAMLMMDIGPGDEVIMPSFGFVSTANSILLRGAKPVFAEIDEATANLDPESLPQRINSRTAAIIPVHYAGVSCDMSRILEIAQKHRLRVIEDAAQAFGSSYQGKMLGTLGDAGSFSFHQTKNLITGEGGAILVQNDEYAQRLEILREKGTNRIEFEKGETDQYTWVDTGSSYLMSDLLAAVLEAQLKRQSEIQSRRRLLWERYRAGLSELAASGEIILPCVPLDCEPNHHIFFFRTSDATARARILDELHRLGIGATFHFLPLHTTPYAQSHLGGAPGQFPVTERVAETLIRLPLYPDLSDEDCDYVIQSVRDCFAG